jgi:hypothetical protein
MLRVNSFCKNHKLSMVAVQKGYAFAQLFSSPV